MNELTNNQKVFCQKYVECGVQSEAYMTAYKSCKKESTARANGSRMLTNANVQEYISELQEEIKKTSILSAEERMRLLTRIIKGEEQGEEIVVEGIDKGVTEARTMMKGPSLNDKIKAIDTLNKMDGVYVTKVQDITPPTIIDDV